MIHPIKIGLVGLGRAGWDMHCKELEGKASQFQITAVCDPIADRRELAETRYGCKSYVSIEELVKDESVELVDIASRSSDHYAHAVCAIQAGKHIFMEKPMAFTYEEAVHMAELASKRGVQIFVRHNRRFDSDFLHVREMIISGLLGEVFRIKLIRHNFQRRDDWQTIKKFGGGQLLNWGPHIIDHALRLLESPIKLIWSHLRQVAAAGDAEDDVKIVLTGENERVVDLEISGGVMLPSPTYLVYGTRGSLSLTGNQIHVKVIDPDYLLQPIVANPGTPGEGFGSTGTFQSKEEIRWKEETLEVQPAVSYDIWEELYQSMRMGKEFPIKLEEALEVMRVISEVKKGTPFEVF